MPSIPHLRLRSQLLAGNGAGTAHAVVSHLGAVQAQDYLGALWAIGSRMRKAVEADVEQAIARGRIVRYWPMRGTLHFTAAEDVRWMLQLLAPRVLARHRLRLQREFELDARTLRRCRILVERALRDGNSLTRPELYGVLEDAGIATSGSRGLHVIFTLAHERVLCFGPRRGKQPSFVLLDDWVPPSPPKTRDEALAELAIRYFRGHGPATNADLMWWSGLTAREVQEAVDLAGSKLKRQPAAAGAATTRVHLLPPFDEYTVAYRDRSAIVDPEFAKRVNAGGGMISAVVLVNGRVSGNWKRTFRGKSVDVQVAPFRALTPREQQALDREIARYTAFVT